MAHLLLLLVTSLYTVSLYSMKDIEYYKKKEEKEISEYKEFSRYRATTLKDYSDSIIDACFDCDNNVIIATKNKIRFFNKDEGRHSLQSFCYALKAKELLNGLDREWQHVWSNPKKKQLYASTDLFFYKNSKKFTQCLVLLQYDEKLEKFVPQQKGYFKNKRLSYLDPETGFACLCSGKKYGELYQTLGRLSTYDQSNFIFQKLQPKDKSLKYAEYNNKHRICVMLLRKKCPLPIYPNSKWPKNFKQAIQYYIKLISLKEGGKTLWKVPIDKADACFFNNPEGEKIVYFDHDNSTMYARDAFTGNVIAMAPSCDWGKPPFDTIYPLGFRPKKTRYTSDHSHKIVIDEDDIGIDIVSVYKKTDDKK